MAVDILGYQGQAELGFGADGQPYPGPSDAALNKYQDFNTHLQQQNFQWNQTLYQQAVKDRDDVMSTFAQQDIDSPVLEKDMPELQKQLADIKDTILKTPNIKANTQEYLKWQKQLADFKAAKTYAKTRYTIASAQQIAAAKETDPQLKEKMQQHVNGQIDKGLFHVIDPFNTELDWSDKDLYPDPPVITSKGNAQFKDGLAYSTTVSESNLDDMVKHFSYNALVDGENKTLPDQIKKFYTFAANNPDVMNDKSLTQINTKLNQINQSKGLKPGDNNYINPIATKGDDGQWQASAPVDFAKAWYVYHKYKKTENTTLDSEVQKQLLTKAQADAARANASESYANAAKYKADAAKAKKEGDKIGYETALLKSQASQEVNEAMNFFVNQTKSGGFEKLNLAGPMAGQMKVGVPVTFAKDAGIGDDWEIKELNSRDKTVVGMLSQASPEMMTNDATLKSFVTRQIVKPDRVIIARSPDGDVNSTVLIGLDKDGNVMKTVNVDNGWGELIKANSDFDSKSDAVQRKLNAGRLIVEEKQGSNAIGTDLGAIQNSNEVVDNTGTQSIKNGTLRQQGDKIQVFVNGQWKKAIGKDAAGNIITE